MLTSLSQDPTDPKFVQDPYAFYEQARATAGPIFHWTEYGMPAVLSYSVVSAILRDRRFGRQPPAGLEPEKPPHQADFWAVEDHSMLEMEPPRHTRLRKLVLHAFTSRRVAGMAPEIAALAEKLLDDLPSGPFDLLPVFANKLPMIVIARLLGVPEDETDSMLGWSHAMVSMYQAGRSYEVECAANRAAREFSDYLTGIIAYKRRRPADDLLSELIAAEEAGDRLSAKELITTAILLLNAGHEATVHTIGNGVQAMLANGYGADVMTPDKIEAATEEILRYDTPLHLFDRWAYEDIELGSFVVPKHTKIACLLGAANRDPQRWVEADRFDPLRPVQTNASFGAGTHFCIGAPLARLELNVALPVLFSRLPDLRLSGPGDFAPTYHFHGLTRLVVEC